MNIYADQYFLTFGQRSFFLNFVKIGVMIMKYVRVHTNWNLIYKSKNRPPEDWWNTKKQSWAHHSLKSLNRS